MENTQSLRFRSVVKCAKDLFACQAVKLNYGAFVLLHGVFPLLVVGDLVLFRELVKIDAGSNARFAVDAIGTRIAMVANGFFRLTLFVVHFSSSRN